MDLVRLIHQSACPRCLSQLSLMPIPSGHPRLPVPATHPTRGWRVWNPYGYGYGWSSKYPYPTRAMPYALASRLNVESVTGQPTHDWCAARWSRIGWRGTQGMDTGAGEPLPPNRRFPSLSLPGLSPGNGQSGNCKSCVYGFGPELMLRIQTEHVCMAIHARIPAQSAHVCTQEHSAATPFSVEIQSGRVHVICSP